MCECGVCEYVGCVRVCGVCEYVGCGVCECGVCECVGCESVCGGCECDCKVRRISLSFFIP